MSSPRDRWRVVVGLLAASGTSIAGLWLGRRLIRRDGPVGEAPPQTDVPNRPVDHPSSEESLRALLASAPVAITTIDTAGCIDMWNPAAERLFGWSAAEVRGRPPPEIPHERRAEADELMRTALGGLARDAFETERLHRDGHRIRVLMTTAPIRDEVGTIHGGIALFEDLTERRRTERAIRERDQQLSAVLQLLPVGVVIVDADGHVVEANPSVVDILGDRPPADADIEGLRAWWAKVRCVPEDREWGLLQALESGVSTGPDEVEIERPDGTRASLLCFARPVLDTSGRIAGAVSVAVDISERRRREEAERFLLATTRILSSSLDYEETIERVATAAVPVLADWCVIFERRPAGIHRLAASGATEWIRALAAQAPTDEQIPPHHPVHTAIAEGRPELLATLDDATLDRIVVDADHRERLRALGLRSLIVAPMLLRGHALGALAFGSRSRSFDADDLRLAEQVADRAAIAIDNARLYRDAAHRAQEEQALREATSVLAASFTTEEVIREIAHRALEAIDAEGAFVERIDIEHRDLVVVATAGRRAPDLGSRLPFEQSLAQRVIETRASVLIPDVSTSSEPIAPHILSLCGDCSVIAVPLVNSGEPLGMLVVLRGKSPEPFSTEEVARARSFADLAALAFRRVHLLEEAERRREELEDLTASRAQLVRGFSHDVRNPLGTARLHLELLDQGRMGPLGEAQKETLASAIRSVRSALRLLDDLVEVARSASEGLQVDRRPTSVDRAANEIMNEYVAHAENKGLTMAFDRGAPVPVIESDPSRIRQILGNLISNAVKYTDEGSIRVTVREREGGIGPGRWVTVSVSDTGRGIDPDDLPRLFQEFARLHTGTEPGFGLGLAIAKRLATALGGDITVESAPGRGSAFTLWLPVPADAG